MLYLGVLILAVTAFFSLGETHKSGLMMYPTLIAPAVVPMLYFVIPLDMIMCTVLMSGKKAQERRRYKHMIGSDFAALLLLFIAWLPFYWRLLSL